MASKGHEVENKIPKLYKRTAINLLMYGYVTGVRATLHTIHVGDAIIMFMETFGLSHEEYNIDSAKVIYNRMQKEFLNL